jgi:ParB-like chromosome segregation protein Spo0J
MKIEQIKTAELIPYARNTRTHSEAQVAQIAGSIREFGFTNPVLIDNENGIIAGHGRVMAAQKLGLAKVPCIRLGHLTDTQRRAYIIADNKLALNAGWDEEMLALELGELGDLDFDLSLIGFDESELGELMADPAEEAAKRNEVGAGSLSAKFGIPPFSVLNAREGWWQERKRAWLAIGIKSELGRGDELIGKAAPNSAYGKQSTGVDENGKLTYKESVGNTSTFDPVLCELAYRWFSPVGGVVLDSFAGGSVRGIVASHCGRQYIGMDLRAEQIEANRAQADVARDPQPVWHCGDSLTIDKVCADVDADFIFSCPPYADLEVYSDDPADLSTMSYEDFRAVYFEIIAKACSRLKEDRFACFVVGDVRDKKGNYYNFVGDTVEAFRAAGLHFYNEAILVTCVGSLPIRAGKQFTAGRKLGKTHQNVLVFVKGDGKKATAACGECDFGELSAEGIDDAKHLSQPQSSSLDLS